VNAQTLVQSSIEYFSVSSIHHYLIVLPEKRPSFTTSAV